MHKEKFCPLQGTSAFYFWLQIKGNFQNQIPSPKASSCTLKIYTFYYKEIITKKKKKKFQLSFRNVQEF